MVERQTENLVVAVQVRSSPLFNAAVAQLALLHKHTLSLVNDELDENFQFGQIMFVDELVREPNNKWKQKRVDKAIKLLDEYKQRRETIVNS